MPESMNVDQRVQLVIGQLTIQNVCFAKEIEDLRAQLAAAAPAAADPAKPADHPAA